MAHATTKPLEVESFALKGPLGLVEQVRWQGSAHEFPSLINILDNLNLLTETIDVRNFHRLDDAEVQHFWKPSSYGCLQQSLLASHRSHWSCRERRRHGRWHRGIASNLGE